MDSISQIFGAPGGTPPFFPGSGGGGGASGGGGDWLSKILPFIGLGGGVAGTIGNIQANAARNKVLSSEMNQMRMLERLTPAQIAQGISALQQPLSGNLTHNVGNVVQGQLAERGLSQAPGIFGQSLAQGLAPYELQEQQMAQDAYFKKLGLPISARPSPFGPFPNTTNTSQLWQMLMSRFMGMNPNRPGSPGTDNQMGLDKIFFGNLGNGGSDANGVPNNLPFNIPGLTDNPMFGTDSGGGGG